ncbi:MAG: ABC transporter permease, partial [Verrucomicrobia bacterium]|nr:ABC transporter permease [Verrucomicrobiota bacterium]
MAYQLPEFAILALAIHPSMLTGGIDLSVVSVANLSAIAAAFLMRSVTDEFLWLAIPTAFLVGAIAGSVNGVLVAGFQLPAILA